MSAWRRLTAVLATALIFVLAVGGVRLADTSERFPEIGAPLAAESTLPVVPVTVAPPLAEVGAAIEGQPLPPEPEPSPVEAAAPALPMPAENAQLVRLVIPKARVDHTLSIKGLTERREMEDPGGKDSVAWYNFSARPGFGSNAVFSAHVDWYTGERGAFWFLRDLQEGDEALVSYSDGLTLTYRVTRVNVYPADNAPVAEITGPAAADVITLITCDGVFVRNRGDYNQRRVVVAERVS